MDDNRKRPQAGLNEGEGSKTADKRYRQGATEFATRTDTLQKGLEAEREVENYRDEYEQAEKSGKAHGGGDLRRDLASNNTPRPRQHALSDSRPPGVPASAGAPPRVTAISIPPP